jgi:sugar O-acyltransferase (sialic acid O-acetyltransferase NeuD family)
VAEPLVIVGAGGSARETLDVVAAINSRSATYNFLGFVADGHADTELISRRGAEVIGEVEALRSIDAAYVIAIGSPEARKKIDILATSWGRKAEVLVHPGAIVASEVRLGPGTIVCAHATLTTNITTGRHTQVNVNASLSHDCVVGDYATLSPGSHVAGRVELGEGAFLGVGASVVPGRTIGSWAVVGAGAVVVTDVPPATTFVGVPARLRAMPSNR